MAGMVYPYDKQTAYKAKFFSVLSISLALIFVIIHFSEFSTKYTSLYIVIEFFSIFMAFSIALILWYTYEYSQGFLQILGVSFFAIGFLKLFHILSFPGMPQFITDSSETKALMFWYASRLLEPVSLLASSIIAVRSYQVNLSRKYCFRLAVAASFTALLTVSYLAPFLQNFFLLKKMYYFNALVILLLILAMRFFKQYSSISSNNSMFIIGGMIAGVFAEAALIFHTGASASYNLLGHIYKLVFYSFIFHVLFGSTVRKPFRDIEKLLDQTVSSISRALDRRDRYTYNHSARVAEYACLIGQVLQVDKKIKETLRLSGLLHDIGKIAVPDSVLNKESSLTDEEWEMVKTHPVKGAEILEPIERLQILRGIAEHHERIDGKGYPEGKRGDGISLEARILAVADTFDAITTDRVYRPKKSKEEAFDILLKSAGTQLDNQVVNAFIKADRQGLVDIVMSKYNTPKEKEH